jgi:hypothetical protein
MTKFAFEEFYLLGNITMKCTASQPIFWRNMLLDFQWTRWHYIAETELFITTAVTTSNPTIFAFVCNPRVLTC